jgi:hypothetical protein
VLFFAVCTLEDPAQFLMPFIRWPFSFSTVVGPLPSKPPKNRTFPLSVPLSFSFLLCLAWHPLINYHQRLNSRSIPRLFVYSFSIVLSLRFVCGKSSSLVHQRFPAYT